MAELYTIQKETVQNIVNAVKNKTNNNEELQLTDLPNKITNLPFEEIQTISLRLYRLGSIPVGIYKIIYTGLNENNQIQFFELEDIADETIVNNVIPNTFIYTDDTSHMDSRVTHHLKDCITLVGDYSSYYRTKTVFQITGNNPEIGFEDDD